MKKLVLSFLFTAASFLAQAASVPLGMAQVEINPATGLIQGLPVVNGTGGSTSAVSVTAFSGSAAPVLGSLTFSASNSASFAALIAGFLTGTAARESTLAAISITSGLSAGFLTGSAATQATLDNFRTYARNTTESAGAYFVSPVHMRNVSQAAMPLSVTFASGVFGTTFFFLTPSSRNRLTLINPLASGKDINFLLHTSATVPTDTSTNREEVLSGSRLVLENPVGTFLHIWSQGGTPSVPVVRKYEYAAPMTGTAN